MLRVLFVRSRNKWRSPTAEHIFADRDGIDCDSAGLAPDAVTPLTRDQVQWADIIFVMEARHKRTLSRRFGANLGGKRVVVLGIPDQFGFMDEALIARLRAKVPPHFR